MAMAIKENVDDNLNKGLSDEQLNELSKISYGLTDKDISELMVFINEFNEAGLGIKENPTYEDLKPIVDSGNKIPSHCGFMITSYYANRNGEDALVSLIEKIYNVYLQLKEEDPESTKTTDLYETIGCLIMFSQHYIVRKFIINDFDRAVKLIEIMRKRPAVSSVLMSCLAEIYIVSKDKQKYEAVISDNLQKMLDFLSTKNGITPEIPNAIDVNFNDLRKIISDYLDKGNKKESLTQVNNLINKKADVGQAFFDCVAINPSVIGRVIDESATITEDMIEKLIRQMRVQHAVECLLLLSNYVGEKLNKAILYVKEAYNLENIEDYYDRLHNIVQKGGMYHYGILLRHTDLMPKIRISDTISLSNIQTLQLKLSTIENNLTADISEKSMSITIAPLGRSRIYQDICDKLEGVDEESGGQASGFVAKLRDKNIVKKIRESGISYFAMDQYCGSIIIKCLQAMIEVLEKNPNIDVNHFIQEVYKQMVLKYKLIHTLESFKSICNSLFLNENEEDED